MMPEGRATDFAPGYSVTQTRTPADIEQAQRFRARCFGLICAQDTDSHDHAYDHVLIRDVKTSTLVCCFRILSMRPAEISRSYAARYYDLSRLEQFDGHMLELGRFCIDPARRDSTILRLAWATLTDLVDTQGVKLLFGCSSFAGMDPTHYTHAFAYLNRHARAPARWAPQPLLKGAVFLAQSAANKLDRRKALCQMPPLLRSYIGMGGWVSDHAVVDQTMNTLHVFTGLEIDAIPPVRQRLLRALRAAR